MASRGFLGIDGTRNVTAQFRVENAVCAGELNKMKASFFPFPTLVDVIHSATFTSFTFIFSKKLLPTTATANRDKNLEETITLCNMHGGRVTTCTF